MKDGRNQPASIRDCPPELIVDIFKFFCEPKRTEASLFGSKPSVLVNHPNPLLLGKICKDWRQLAWSTSSLWTYISLVVKNKKCALQLDLLSQWLHRTSDLPLTIVFKSNYNRSIMPLKLIVNQCRRWESIDIEAPPICLEVIRDSSLHFPLLRSASILANNEEIEPLVPIDILCHAPQLQEVAVSHMKLPKHDNLYIHLTHFTALYMPADSVLNVLNLTPNLRKCSLEFIGPPAYSSQWMIPHVPPVRLPHLESLTLRDCVTSSILPHLDEVPLLHHFRCSVRSIGVLPVGIIQELVERCRCSIEVLELGGGTILIPLLNNLLRHTSSVRKFVLDLDSATGNTVVILANAVADLLSPLWPPAPPFTNPNISFMNDATNPVLLPNLLHFELLVSAKPSNYILSSLKHRWLFGSASTDSSADLTGLGKPAFVKIRSVRLPSFCRMDAMNQLADEIEEGLVVEFAVDEDAESFIPSDLDGRD